MKQTSRIFDTWQALYDLLAAQPWTPHPTTGELPLVVFGDEALDAQTSEMVVVVGVPENAPAMEWSTFGSTASQAEQFVLQITAGTRVYGMSRVEAFDRLKDLCEVVQQSLRSPTTGRPVGGFSESAGSPGPLWWAVTQVRPVLFATDEGFGAYADINIQFNATI